eukprot:5686006-Pyramimonas_sp.AAC.1
MRTRHGVCALHSLHLHDHRRSYSRPTPVAPPMIARGGGVHISSNRCSLASTGNEVYIFGKGKTYVTLAATCF